MNDSLRERKKSERRNAILDAFATELELRSIDSISMDEIAKRVDTSRATIFNYFQSKTDIIFGIADREIDAIERFIGDESDRKSSPTETIYTAVYRLVSSSFINHHVAWRVLTTILEDPERTDSPLRRLSRTLEHLVQDAQNCGEFDARLDAGGCARSILGTYLAELFNLASQPTPSDPLTREVFDSVASQLVMQWTVDNA